jgi:hypothetical protein
MSDAGPGRPAFTPTDNQRRIVRMLLSRLNSFSAYRVVVLSLALAAGLLVGPGVPRGGSTSILWQT